MVDSFTQTADGAMICECWALWENTAMAVVASGSADDPSSSEQRQVVFLTSDILVEAVHETASRRHPEMDSLRSGGETICLTMMRGDVDISDRGERHDARRELRIYVPRSVFIARVPWFGDLSRAYVGTTSSLSVLFRNYIREFLKELPAMSQREADAGLDSALQLLSGFAAPRVDPSRNDEERLSDDMLSGLAMQYIESMFDDPGFDVMALARATGVSRSRLYRIFDRQGGVATVIRRHRLDRARTRLTDPSQRHLTTRQIASDCGFALYTNFCRAFRSYFGVTPREMRKSRLPSNTDPVGVAQARSEASLRSPSADAPL